ncbi:MAG: hypothetical protein KAT96_00370 [Candidatus Omnitrophica bacterium]|nr:hypothetical protein [Candidatus Omnitrophota bacterium]
MSKKKKASNYLKYFEEKDKEWESLCRRCGACCGAYDDPCLHLKKDKEGKYNCEIYSERFGLKKSIKGEEFNCVPIKEIIKTHWKNDHLCAYKKLSKQGWAQVKK